MLLSIQVLKRVFCLLVILFLETKRRKLKKRKAKQLWPIDKLKIEDIFIIILSKYPLNFIQRMHLKSDYNFTSKYYFTKYYFTKNKHIHDHKNNNNNFK